MRTIEQIRESIRRADRGEWWAQCPKCLSAFPAHNIEIGTTRNGRCVCCGADSTLRPVELHPRGTAAELEERRKWGPHWCDRCALYYGDETCPGCRADAMSAELERLRKLERRIQSDELVSEMFGGAKSTHTAYAAIVAYRARLLADLPGEETRG